MPQCTEDIVNMYTEEMYELLADPEESNNLVPLTHLPIFELWEIKNRLRTSMIALSGS
jgi:hypothetical protein